jgi:hypothetical protein
MHLRNRAHLIETHSATPNSGFEHLAGSSLAVMRWLAAGRIEYVLVGPVARAIRGDSAARGPVAIVAAPYGRNLDRLARALSSAHARPRVARDGEGGEPGPIRFSAEKLLRPERWALSCGLHNLDLEGHGPGGPRYQELLYEASRFEPAANLTVEVAAPEDIERYEAARRTGVLPEIKISRVTARDPSIA